MTEQIKCSGVSLGYNGKNVVENLNFSINAGDYIFIVGENGSGKSTLIKGLLSLIKPVKGEFVFAKGFSKNHIGYYPQNINLRNDFPVGVKEIVLTGCLSKKPLKLFCTKKDKVLAQDIMKTLDVETLQNFSFAELSGGQRQRVLLARALCASEKMIILDEPIANLDPVATEEFYKTLDMLNREYNLTVIMVSHHIDGLLKYSKKVLHLGDTKNFFGDTETYLSNELGKKFSGGDR